MVIQNKRVWNHSLFAFLDWQRLWWRLFAIFDERHRGRIHAEPLASRLWAICENVPKVCPAASIQHLQCNNACLE